MKKKNKPSIKIITGSWTETEHILNGYIKIFYNEEFDPGSG